MINRYFNSEPNTTVAYHNDGTYDYYGKAGKGSATSSARWTIVRMAATGNWITEYPNGSDEPKFVWDSVTGLTYRPLGT